MLAAPQPSGFGSRGRLRRRARFLRKARELAYRDLGGLVFNLHRFGARNDALVLAKLTTVGQIDAELRKLEAALDEREPVTVLREAGINACPRCAAIHSSEDRFCPNCGLSMGRHADLPIAGTAAPGTSAPATVASTAPTAVPTTTAAAPTASPVAPTPAPQAAPATPPPAAPTAPPDPTPPADTAPPVAARRATVTRPISTDAATSVDASSAEQPTEILRSEPTS
jgi:zinc-ribbon domain